MLWLTSLNTHLHLYTHSLNTLRPTICLLHPPAMLSSLATTLASSSSSFVTVSAVRSNTRKIFHCQCPCVTRGRHHRGLLCSWPVPPPLLQPEREKWAVAVAAAIALESPPFMPSHPISLTFSFSLRQWPSTKRSYHPVRHQQQLQAAATRAAVEGRAWAHLRTHTSTPKRTIRRLLRLLTRVLLEEGERKWMLRVRVMAMVMQL